MAENSDGSTFPLWIEAITAVVVALVSAAVGAASTGILITLGITKKFHELRLHIDQADSTRFHAMVNIVQGEVTKTEVAQQTLSDRLGACEQDIAVLRHFMKRIESLENHK